MKITNSVLIRNVVILFFVTVLLCTSCLTTSSTQEVNPNFIGDFDPIQLSNGIWLRESMGSLKPVEVRLFFVPRTNIIEAYLRDGMTTYVLLFEGHERMQVAEGIDLYAVAYAAHTEGDKTALPIREPNRKNYFNTGTMSVSWGLINSVRNNTTIFQTNYKYFDGDKPYFEILVETTKDKDEPSVVSAPLRLYFSPANLEALL